MNITRPKVGIKDTIFLLDYKKRMLQQWADPDNIIYLDRMVKVGGGMQMTYDSRIKNQQRDFSPEGADDRFLTQVFIPDYMLQWRLHPPQSNIFEFNGYARSMGWQLEMPSAALNQRLMGVLPTIDIAGDNFTIDWAEQKLRYTAYPDHEIPVSGMEQKTDGSYLFFYDQEHKGLYAFDDDITQLPKKVILAEIPAGKILDPVAVGNLEHVPELEMERLFPYQATHTAKITPLEKTILPELVADNLRELQRPLPGALGSYVLVDPALAKDSHRGKTGKVIQLHDQWGMAQVGFSRISKGLYSLNDLLVLKTPKEIKQALFSGRNKLSLSASLILMDIYKLSIFGKPEHIKQAMYNSCLSPGLLRMATVSLQEALHPKQGLDQEPGERRNPGRGR